MALAVGARPAAARALPVLIGVLVLSIAVNYVDRGSLSVAAATPGFRQDIPLPDTRLGLLFSAFFWSYAAFQVVAGYLIDRHGAVRVLTAGFLVWCAATMATGLAGGFASLLAFRLLLGAGEAVAYPAYSKIIAAGVPERWRGTANSAIDAGSRAGAALCVLVGGVLAARYGWRAMLLVIGGAGLLWLIPWRLCAARVPAPPPDPKKAGAALAKILGRRQAWGTFLGLFCLNYSWYFVLSWLPSYLTRERHFTTKMMAVYGSLPFWGIAVTCALFGWFSDRMIARGSSPGRVRIGFTSAGLLLSTLMLPACLISDQAVSMTLLVIACLSLGLTSSNLWAVSQTLAGPRRAAQWVGLQNAFGNLAGIIGPYFTGWIVSKSGGFLTAFVVAAAMSLAGACSYLFLVRNIEPLRWDE